MKGNGKTPPPANVTEWDDERYVEVKKMYEPSGASAPTTPADAFDFHTSNLENEAQAREDRIRELTAEIREMERARMQRGGMAPPHKTKKRELWVCINRELFFWLACAVGLLTVVLVYVS
jgi:hypothetical protein